jgi:hypothetical protein
MVVRTKKSIPIPIAIPIPIFRGLGIAIGVRPLYRDLQI